MGAECGNAARSDLCGGRAVTRVRTAIAREQFKTARFEQTSITNQIRGDSANSDCAKNDCGKLDDMGLTTKFAVTHARTDAPLFG